MTETKAIAYNLRGKIVLVMVRVRDITVDVERIEAL